MTLFDLEGVVSLNTTKFDASIAAVNLAIDALFVKIQTLESKKIFGGIFSGIFSEAAESGADIFSDLGGTLWELLKAGLLKGLGSLVIGDVEVGVKFPDSAKLAKDAAAAFETIRSEIEQPLNIPVPNMPSVSSTVSAIQGFWNSVKSQLDLSVTATINVQTNHGGGAGNRIGSTTGGGGGFLDWAIDTLNTIGQPITNLFEGKPMFASGASYIPMDNYPAILHRGEMVLTKRQADAYRSGRGGADTSAILAKLDSVVDAIGSMSVNMDGNRVGDIVTNRVSRNIAKEARVRR